MDSAYFFTQETTTKVNWLSHLINSPYHLDQEITASVQQCGFLSELFEVQRGCRQGDPIGLLEFLLPVQFMFLMIHANIDIKGIKIKGREYKMTQYADDTTMILDGTQKSLQMSLNTIEIFGSYSGLKDEQGKNSYNMDRKEKGN